MLCQFCLRDFAEGKTKVPPAEATHIVAGPMTLGIMPLCTDHANPSEDDNPYYTCYAISDPRGQALLNQYTAQTTPAPEGEKK